MTDINELAPLARQGDPDALDRLMRAGYRIVVSRIDRMGRFLPPGWGDIADLAQEGMIGLTEALRYWRPDSGLTFVRFASLCIDRQIDQAVRTALRVKHEMLNRARRLDAPLPTSRSDREPVTLMGVVKGTGDGGADPLEELLRSAGTAEARRMLAEFRRRITPPLEQFVFDRCIVGQVSYKAAADEYGVAWKSIDNARQRIMKKLRAVVLDMSRGEQYSRTFRELLGRCAKPDRRSGGRPAVTEWIGDLAEGA